MKKSIYKYLFSSAILSLLFFSSCEEKNFSEDYDIKLPVSEIIDFNPKVQVVDGNVTVYGENLDMVTSLSIGSSTCEIISQEAGQLVFKVSRSTSIGNIVVQNKYKRENVSLDAFTPTYLDVKISQWPTEIEATKSFNITGLNVDMIQSVKFEDLTLKRTSASPTTATFSAADLAPGVTGKLTVITKTGQTLVSPAINIIVPKTTYIPKSSIILFDFDAVMPTIVAGDATGAGAKFTAGINASNINPFFGKYYSVTAALGNGWDGRYQILETNNGGNGFNLTDYKNPHITFLVNTNGKKGYFNPALTISGATEDKHFTGQEGDYTDSYLIQTSGWEWRSYNLQKMGFSNPKTAIEKISLYIRGGNVGNGNTDAFEINLDQVMITDGPLNPVVVLDFETMPPFANGTAGLNQGSGIEGAAQGLKYLTVKNKNVEAWKVIGNTKKTDNDGSKFAENQTFYVNFLVNTGNSGAAGYFQLVFEQAGGTKLGKHFAGENSYGDNYMFANTAGKWQWRSYKIDPKGLENWGSVPELKLGNPFDLTVEFSTGNVAGPFETNVDYMILTSVPLDTSH